MKAFKFLIFALLMICIIGTVNAGQIKWRSYLDIAKENANSHDYDINNYNCMNFSETLAKDLTSAGYDAKVIYGWMQYGRYNVGGTYLTTQLCEINLTKDCIQPHAWVQVMDNGNKVWIEATRGVIIER